MHFRTAVIASAVLALLCNGRDDNPADVGATEEYFRATVADTSWSADPDLIQGVVTNVGTGPLIALSGTHSNESEYFWLQFTYFTGSDTAITLPEPVKKTIMRLTANGRIWECGNGNLSVNRSHDGGVEVYSGTFSGTFEDPISVGVSLTILSGQFLVRRLL